MNATGTNIPAAEILPPHEVTDEALRANLADSMRTNGWQGAPVVWDPSTGQALTGSHRIAAAGDAGVDVAAVDVRTIAAEHGLDWDEIVEDTAAGWLTDPHAAAVQLAALLPADVVTHYGLDAH